MGRRYGVDLFVSNGTSDVSNGNPTVVGDDAATGERRWAVRTELECVGVGQI